MAVVENKIANEITKFISVEKFFVERSNSLFSASLSTKTLSLAKVDRGDSDTLFIISSFISGFFLIPGRVAVGSSTERRQKFLDRGARIEGEESGRQEKGERRIGESSVYEG